MLICALILPI